MKKKTFYIIIMCLIMISFVTSVITVAFLQLPFWQGVILLSTPTFTMAFAIVLFKNRAILSGIERLFYKYRKRTEEPRLSDTHFADAGVGTESYVWEVDDTGRFVFVSSSVENVLGHKPKDLIEKKCIWDLSPPSYRDKIRSLTLASLKEGNTITNYENLVQKTDGESVWVSSSSIPIHDKNFRIVGAQGWDTDITVQKKTEEKVIKSEKKFRTLFESMEEAFILTELIHDEDGEICNYRFLDANRAYANYTGTDIESVRGSLITDVFNTDEPAFLDKYKELKQTNRPVSFSRYFSPLKKYFRISLFSPHENQVAVLFLDITQQQKFEQTIEHLSYHDKVTGLPNRRYYSENIPFLSSAENLPLSIILADINALKLANDAFGHHVGDGLIEACADLIKKHTPEGALAARIGGDEFVLLLPKTDTDSALGVMKTLKKESLMKKVSNVELSMSFGLATLNDNSSDYDTVFKHAETKMYRYKLIESPKSRKRIVDTIEKKLHKEYRGEDTHAKHVTHYALALGKALGLSESDLESLGLVARYHDIGKIALDKEMLNHFRPLGQTQWLDVTRHSEIGYRIMGSMTKTAGIADDILAHHENFDGSGYPLALKGKAIPLFARIIRIVDTYDALCTKKARGLYADFADPLKTLVEAKEKALDPELTDLFIREVLKEKDTHPYYSEGAR